MYDIASLCDILISKIRISHKVGICQANYLLFLIFCKSFVEKQLRSALNSIFRVFYDSCAGAFSYPAGFPAGSQRND